MIKKIDNCGHISCIVQLDINTYAEINHENYVGYDDNNKENTDEPRLS